MPVFSSIVAILFSLNCQKQDYILNHGTVFVNSSGVFHSILNQSPRHAQRLYLNFMVSPGV